MPTSYSDYLRLQELLALQRGLEGDEKKLGRDELLFITVHQIDELWFKLVLSELEKVRDLFGRGVVAETEIAPAARSLRRVVKTFELAADHFALIETMTPRDFLDFRGKLLPASGFQSPQFREIELLMGLPAAGRVPLGAQDDFLAALAPRADLKNWAREKVERRLRETPTLKAALEHWLERTPIDGSTPRDPDDAARVDAFLHAFLERHRHEVETTLAQAQAGGASDAAVEQRFRDEIDQARMFLLCDDRARRRTRAAALFIETYRELPLLAWPREVLDLVIQLEQSFLVFRQRHARMVERMIGRRVGTGGSAGVDYLDETALRYRVFDDLWCVRTLLIRKEAAPPLENADRYYDLHA